MIVRKLSDNTKVYIDRYFTIVDKMGVAMREVAQTDSISEMYIWQNISLISGEVQMSENILSYTTNANIETLAKALIDDGKQAVDDLKEMLDYCTNCKNEDRDVNLYQRRFAVILENSVSNMNNINLTNNIELDYLNGLIAHHEGAIGMAKNLLNYEVCENIRAYAENLITTHELQLGQMRQLLRILG